MFEFNKLCDECEALSSFERGSLIVNKSVMVIKRMNELELDIDPTKTLITFILGSIVSDSLFNEKDFLIIYPSLTKAFGTEYDYQSIKTIFKQAKDIRKIILATTKDLMKIISSADETLRVDIITLCLLIVSADRKISLKEKRYIRQLLKK